MSMRTLVLSLAVLCAASCGGAASSPRTGNETARFSETPVVIQDGSKYYAEVFKNGKLYLFGDQARLAEFQKNSEFKLMQTRINVGLKTGDGKNVPVAYGRADSKLLPGGEDEAKIRDARVWKTFTERYNITE